jgi:hypothetical protein
MKMWLIGMLSTEPEVSQLNIKGNCVVFGILSLLFFSSEVHYSLETDPVSTKETVTTAH